MIKASLGKTKLFALVFSLLLVFSVMVGSVHADQVEIDSDVKSNAHVKLCTILYKDTSETNPEWDNYAVKVTVEDLWTKNDPWAGPLVIAVFLYFPPYADERTSHEPRSGWVWSDLSWSLSFEGVGMSGRCPWFQINYESKNISSYYLAHWDVRGCVGPFALWFVMNDYSEYGLVVRVPQGKDCFCYVDSWVAFFGAAVFVAYLKNTDWVGFCHVGTDSTEPTVEPQAFNDQYPWKPYERLMGSGGCARCFPR